MSTKSFIVLFMDFMEISIALKEKVTPTVTSFRPT